jgi:hypothetical protein
VKTASSPLADAVTAERDESLRARLGKVQRRERTEPVNSSHLALLTLLPKGA